MPAEVLIVQDSRTEALRTRLILERAGYTVSLAADGRAALSQAATEQPDLILLDTMLPHSNSLETCGKLKLDPRTRQIPVVVLTTNGEESDMPSGPGLECFLPKPYEPQRLVSRVQELTRAGNGQDTAYRYGQRDVSSAELTTVQSELAETRRQLAAARQARSDLLANISHELRTPLHEIIGMAELVAGTQLTAEQQGYVKTVQASSNILLSLIADVIEFTELEAGPLPLEAKEFDPAEPIGRVGELLGPLAVEKGLRLSTALAADVPRGLVGDPHRLRQVLTNLVANGIKFTEQGEVAMSVALQTQHAQEVELLFGVRDTGVGIPPDRLEIIFEPFQQADMSATRRHGGLGMGLALAKQIVTRMGGSIRAESEIGKGSTFYFTVKLQVAAHAVEKTTATVSAAPAPRRALEILVAEDSPTNQLIARSSLTKAGHSVTLAANGAEAVKVWETPRPRPFDLILMDISMPVMDGLEATRLIRQKEEAIGGYTLIVAMTAFATKEYHDKCLGAGMDAYVTKPVRIEELNRTLDPLLDRPRPAEPVEPEPVDLKEALEIVGGDADILSEAVAVSLDEVPTQVAALRTAIAQQDAKQIEAKAHRLKGIMGNLGGLPARELGQQLETLGEQHQFDGTLELLTALEREIGRVTAFYSNPAWRVSQRLPADVDARASTCQERQGG